MRSCCAICTALSLPRFEILRHAHPLHRRHRRHAGRRRSCSGRCRCCVASERLDLVIANAENAAGGSGLTPRHLPPAPRRPASIWSRSATTSTRRREIIPTLENDERICKPANFPPDAPGRDYAIVTAARRHAGRRRSACSAGRSCGRSIARSAPPTACWPSSPADVRCIVVDIHAEATGDKYLLGHYLNGRVTRRARHAHARPDRRRADPARRHGVHHATSA